MLNNIDSKTTHKIFMIINMIIFITIMTCDLINILVANTTHEIKEGKKTIGGDANKIS